MGARKKINVPVWFFILTALCLVAFSFRIIRSGAVPERIMHISYILAMPEGAVSQASKLGENIIGFLQSKVEDAEKNNQGRITQKSGSGNDENKENPFSGDFSDFTGDLTVTPDDIAENMKSVKEQTENGEYTEDGEVIEKTFTSNQATDSLGNVHLRNVTDSQSVNLEEIIKKGCELPERDISEPTVLIYHTHSTESYIMTDNGRFSTSYPSRNDDKSVNMIRIGDEITKVLEYNGIGVIHDRSIYDTVYTGAYSKSREGIEAYLEKYPTLTITLDIHRDAVYYDDLTRMKPVTEIEGKKAAQMMIIAGAEGGSVDSFESWRTNLSFAVMLQKTANDKYENLMKPIYFCNRKYNMDITPYSLLIEIGTDVNTLDEAAYSGRLLGDVLSDFIKTSVIDN